MRDGVMFEVIPAIDLKGGKCVQLRQGRASDVIFSTDEPPEEIARRWVALGARTLHIVDLDGAFRGTLVHFQQIKRILEAVHACSSKCKIQVGGGIRDYESAEKLLNAGVERVIFGTVAFRRPEVVRAVAEDFSKHRVMVALDARGGKVAVEGWQHTTEIGVREAAKHAESIGAGSILFTNIDVEGLMRGVNVSAIREVVRAVSVPVVASGGVSSVEDVLAVCDAGAAGVVVGSALYTGKIDFRSAVEAVVAHCSYCDE
ncbi:MAG: 1-(5-phosphoribosyl)-5-[(5-phosphoribosylamino)methylideneamino]imidazole-4-carboxamide isomerase [Candidatus Methanospirare jalkutatii]|nr:1-(5-phosphoribosyl)-5-[(5-phosphoribosylamino)methylideneamino]imidazole-4-carboxamide isomerase [Candidatus Methanospirare jalkutatii]